MDNVDDQIIPALGKNAGKNQPAAYAPGEEFNEEELKDGEPIHPSQFANAQPLIDIFGEPVVRKIFSRTWALREEGISEIESQVLNGRNPNKSEIFIGAINVGKMTIGDKIIGVCQRAIQFLIAVTTSIPSVKLSSSQASQV